MLPNLGTEVGRTTASARINEAEEDDRGLNLATLSVIPPLKI